MVSSPLLNKTNEDSMAVVAFKNFANQLRQPSPYSLMITELKGATNLVIGTLQLLASNYMYSQSPSYNSLADRHFEMGTEAIRQGVIEFVPGALATYGTAYGASQVARMYNVTSSDIINAIFPITHT
jgi:hypothetical protein